MTRSLGALRAQTSVCAFFPMCICPSCICILKLHFLKFVNAKLNFPTAPPTVCALLNFFHGDHPQRLILMKPAIVMLQPTEQCIDWRYGGRPCLLCPTLRTLCLPVQFLPDSAFTSPGFGFGRGRSNLHCFLNLYPFAPQLPLSCPPWITPILLFYIVAYNIYFAHVYTHFYQPNFFIHDAGLLHLPHDDHKTFIWSSSKFKYFRAFLPLYMRDGKAFKNYDSAKSME